MTSSLISEVVSSSLLQRNIEGYVSSTGDTGNGYLVLGHLSDSYRFLVSQTGDFLTGGTDLDILSVSQTADIGDVRRVRVRGTAIFNEPLPDGCYWVLQLEVGANIVPFYFSPDYKGQQYSLDDLLCAVPAQNVTTEVKLSLGYSGNTPIEVVAPTIIVERLDFEENLETLTIGNRHPHPEARNVSFDAGPSPYPASISFDIWQDGATLDPNTLTMWLDGVKIYELQTSLEPLINFDLNTPSTGPALGVTLSPEFTSSYIQRPQDFKHRLRVKAQTFSGQTLEGSWAWTWRDVEPPSVAEVSARTDSSILVKFSEAVLLDTSVNGALNPENYAVLVNEGVGAYTPQVSGVARGTADNEVVVSFSEKLTFSSQYTLQVGAQVQDLAGNSIRDGDRTREFTSIPSTKSDCRRLDIYSMLPNMNRREDITEDLRKFCDVIQDWADQAFYSIDCFSDIYDVERAPIEFIDAMLFELGNPFGCVSLTDLEKRRLVPVLVSIYQQMGSNKGIENAIRFLLGIEVTVCPLVRRDSWILGRSLLGFDTYLGPEDGSPYFYTFKLVTDETLTELQKKQIRCIVDIMKPIHEHLYSLDFEEPQIESLWILEDETFGVLGETTLLNPP